MRTSSSFFHDSRKPLYSTASTDPTLLARRGRLGLRLSTRRSASTHLSEGVHLWPTGRWLRRAIGLPGLPSRSILQPQRDRLPPVSEGRKGLRRRCTGAQPPSIIGSVICAFTPHLLHI